MTKKIINVLTLIMFSILVLTQSVYASSANKDSKIHYRFVYKVNKLKVKRGAIEDERKFKQELQDALYDINTYNDRNFLFKSDLGEYGAVFNKSNNTYIKSVEMSAYYRTIGASCNLYDTTRMFDSGWKFTGGTTHDGAINMYRKIGHYLGLSWPVGRGTIESRMDQIINSDSLYLKSVYDENYMKYNISQFNETITSIIREARDGVSGDLVTVPVFTYQIFIGKSIGDSKEVIYFTDFGKSISLKERDEILRPIQNLMDTMSVLGNRKSIHYTVKGKRIDVSTNSLINKYTEGYRGFTFHIIDFRSMLQKAVNKDAGIRFGAYTDIIKVARGAEESEVKKTIEDYLVKKYDTEFEKIFSKDPYTISKEDKVSGNFTQVAKGRTLYYRPIPTRDYVPDTNSNPLSPYPIDKQKNSQIYVYSQLKNFGVSIEPQGNNSVGTVGRDSLINDFYAKNKDKSINKFYNYIDTNNDLGQYLPESTIYSLKYRISKSFKEVFLNRDPKFIYIPIESVMSFTNTYENDKDAYNKLTRRYSVVKGQSYELSLDSNGKTFKSVINKDNRHILYSVNLSDLNSSPRDLVNLSPKWGMVLSKDNPIDKSYHEVLNKDITSKIKTALKSGQGKNKNSFFVTVPIKYEVKIATDDINATSTQKRYRDAVIKDLMKNPGTSHSDTIKNGVFSFEKNGATEKVKAHLVEKNTKDWSKDLKGYSEYLKDYYTKLTSNVNKAASTPANEVVYNYGKGSNPMSNIDMDYFESNVRVTDPQLKNIGITYYFFLNTHKSSLGYNGAESVIKDIHPNTTGVTVHKSKNAIVWKTTLGNSIGVNKSIAEVTLNVKLEVKWDSKLNKWIVQRSKALSNGYCYYTIDKGKITSEFKDEGGISSATMENSILQVPGTKKIEIRVNGDSSINHYIDKVYSKYEGILPRGVDLFRAYVATSSDLDTLYNTDSDYSNLINYEPTEVVYNLERGIEVLNSIYRNWWYAQALAVHKSYSFRYPLVKGEEGGDGMLYKSEALRQKHSVFYITPRVEVDDTEESTTPPPTYKYNWNNYKHKDISYAEIKQDGYGDELYEAMSGVPSDHKLYNAVGSRDILINREDRYLKIPINFEVDVTHGYDYFKSYVTLCGNCTIYGLDTRIIATSYTYDICTSTDDKGNTSSYVCNVSTYPRAYNGPTSMHSLYHTTKVTVTRYLTIPVPTQLDISYLNSIGFSTNTSKNIYRLLDGTDAIGKSLDGTQVPKVTILKMHPDDPFWDNLNNFITITKDNYEEGYAKEIEYNNLKQQYDPEKYKQYTEHGERPYITTNRYPKGDLSLANKILDTEYFYFNNLKNVKPTGSRKGFTYKVSAKFKFNHRSPRFINACMTANNNIPHNIVKSVVSSELDRVQIKFKYPERLLKVDNYTADKDITTHYKSPSIERLGYYSQKSLNSMTFENDKTLSLKALDTYNKDKSLDEEWSYYYGYNGNFMSVKDSKNPYSKLVKKYPTNNKGKTYTKEVLNHKDKRLIDRHVIREVDLNFEAPNQKYMVTNSYSNYTPIKFSGGLKNTTSEYTKDFKVNAKYSPKHKKVNDVVIYNPITAEEVYISDTATKSVDDQRIDYKKFVEQSKDQTMGRLEDKYLGGDRDKLKTQLKLGHEFEISVGYKANLDGDEELWGLSECTHELGKGYHIENYGTRDYTEGTYVKFPFWVEADLDKDAFKNKTAKLYAPFTYVKIPSGKTKLYCRVLHFNPECEKTPISMSVLAKNALPSDTAVKQSYPEYNEITKKWVNNRFRTNNPEIRASHSVTVMNHPDLIGNIGNLAIVNSSFYPHSLVINGNNSVEKFTKLYKLQNLPTKRLVVSHMDGLLLHSQFNRVTEYELNHATQSYKHSTLSNILTWTAGVELNDGKENRNEDALMLPLLPSNQPKLFSNSKMPTGNRLHLSIDALSNTLLGNYKNSVAIGKRYVYKTYDGKETPLDVYLNTNGNKYKLVIAGEGGAEDTVLDLKNSIPLQQTSTLLNNISPKIKSYNTVEAKLTSHIKDKLFNIRKGTAKPYLADTMGYTIGLEGVSILSEMPYNYLDRNTSILKNLSGKNTYLYDKVSDANKLVLNTFNQRMNPTPNKYSIVKDKTSHYAADYSRFNFTSVLPKETVMIPAGEKLTNKSIKEFYDKLRKGEGEVVLQVSASTKSANVGWSLSTINIQYPRDSKVVGSRNNTINTGQLTRDNTWVDVTIVDPTIQGNGSDIQQGSH